MKVLGLTEDWALVRCSVCVEMRIQDRPYRAEKRFADYHQARGIAIAPVDDYEAEKLVATVAESVLPEIVECIDGVYGAMVEASGWSRAELCPGKGARGPLALRKITLSLALLAVGRVIPLGERVKKQIADHFGVSWRTIYRYAEDAPELFWAADDELRGWVAAICAVQNPPLVLPKEWCE